MAREFNPVGKVIGLSRVPVKSMASEDITETRVGWHGLDADRRYAFVQADDKSGFPWLTARQFPGLVRYRTYLVDPENPRDSAVRVQTPDGEDLPVDAPELMERLQSESGKALHLLHNWSGVFDAMDLSLISVESIRSLEAMVGFELDRRRFRSNVTIEMSPYITRDFPEDKLVGGLLRFGDRDDSATLRVKRKDARCLVVNINPQTVKQDPEVLKQIVKQRKNSLGVYGTTERPGTIKVEDLIFLAKE